MEGGIRKRWLGGAACLVFAMGAPRVASAQVNAADWAARSPGAEFGLAAVAMGSLAAYFLPQHHGEWGPAWARPVTEPYETISDVVGDGVGSGILAITGITMDEGYLEHNQAVSPFHAALRDSLVDVEAAALTTGITFALKRVVGRCRPRSFVQGRCGNLGEDYDAFPSGHTSPVASLAGTRFALAIRSTGDAGYRWGTFGVAEGFTVATMGLRMLAGAHSWQDVLGGWAIGTTTGILVALAHPMRSLPFEVLDVGAAGGMSPTSYSPTAVLSRYPGSQAPVLFRYSGEF